MSGKVSVEGDGVMIVIKLTHGQLGFKMNETINSSICSLNKNK